MFQPSKRNIWLFIVAHVRLDYRAKMYRSAEPEANLLEQTNFTNPAALIDELSAGANTARPHFSPWRKLYTHYGGLMVGISKAIYRMSIF